jgi:hypothetical protein
VKVLTSSRQQARAVKLNYTKTCRQNVRVGERIHLNYVHEQQSELGRLEAALQASQNLRRSSVKRFGVIWRDQCPLQYYVDHLWTVLCSQNSRGSPTEYFKE